MVVAGNWLRKKYDTRDWALDTFPNILFLRDTPHWACLPLLAKADYTVEILKPDYVKKGLVTMRVFESYIASTLCFADRDIRGIKEFVPKELLARNGEEVAMMAQFSNSEKDELYAKWDEKMRGHHINDRIDELTRIMYKEL